MAVEDDTSLLEDTIDEVEIEETDESIDDEGIDDEGEGHVDEDGEGLAGATDGERAEAQGRQETQIRQPSRAERRIQQALKDAKEAREEAARLRAEMQQRQAAPQETSAQRAERLAMMDPEQRVEYLLNEQNSRFEARLAQAEFRAEDRADKAAFDAACASDPRQAKFQQDVEDYLAQMRRTGTNAPRATVLRYVIGDRALSKAPAARTRANNRADVNRERQAARPASTRSDAGAVRGAANEREARRQRLEDQPL